MENRITFNIKTGHHLKFLRPETIKPLGSLKCKITIDENSKNVPHLKITEVALIQRNVVNNNDSRVLFWDAKVRRFKCGCLSCQC